MSDEGTKEGDAGKTDPPADEGKITYEPGDEGKTDPPPADGDEGKKEGNDEPPKKEDFKVEDLKVPEEFKDSADQVQRIAELSQKHELSKESAQELLDNQAELKRSILAEAEKTHEDTVNAWSAEIKADKEIGGTKYKETAEYAQQAVKKFGSESLVKILNDTGYGNHPELVRAFARIGRAMQNDSLVRGTPKGQDRKIEDIFYSKE